MKYTKEEIENSKRIFKSATPKQTVDWYVKWASSLILLTAMVVRSADISNTLDTILSFLGCLGWLFVAFSLQRHGRLPSCRYIQNTQTLVRLGRCYLYDFWIGFINSRRIFHSAHSHFYHIFAYIWSLFNNNVYF